MPDPHVTASGERFARDMRRIREANDVSAEDIRRETMISVHIIESFEQDGLFEHPTFNQVYLRSFVRSYALAVGVDAGRALEELERALEGEYANELAVEYLGDEPEAPSRPEEPTEEPAPEPESRHRPAPATTSEEEPAPSEAASTPDQTPSSPAPARLPDESRRGIWIGIGIVVLIFLAWLLIGVLRGEDVDATQNGSSTPPVPTDSVPVRLEPLPPESLEAAAEPSVEIGDTMYFTIIAQARLNPIRVRRDEDLRRPYYLNRGQAAAFPAQQRIIIEEELDAIRLLVNGHEYPVQSHVVDSQLVLTRDTVQAFLDTTQTEPLELVVPVDTNAVLGD